MKARLEIVDALLVELGEFHHEESGEKMSVISENADITVDAQSSFCPLVEIFMCGHEQQQSSFDMQMQIWSGKKSMTTIIPILVIELILG